MGLCKTSNVSIFTFINASDLKFCQRSYSCCAYRMMRFKGSNGKICKMMTSHFGTLLAVYNKTLITFKIVTLLCLHLFFMLEREFLYDKKTLHTGLRMSYLPYDVTVGRYCRVFSCLFPPFMKPKFVPPASKTRMKLCCP